MSTVLAASPAALAPAAGTPAVNPARSGNTGDRHARSHDTPETQIASLRLLGYVVEASTSYEWVDRLVLPGIA
jgi:hypothetical protein